MIYADTSAIVRAYLPDEPGHEAARAQLLDAAPARVMVCELSRVELSSAVHTAQRAERIRSASGFVAAFDRDCAPDGPLVMVPLGQVFSRAAQLVGEHRIRALDALHLAVAVEHAGRRSDDDPLTFVTRDADQAAAADELGLAVA